jgi:hypothetical protein
MPSHGLRIKNQRHMAMKARRQTLCPPLRYPKGVPVPVPVPVDPSVFQATDGMAAADAPRQWGTQLTPS